MAYATPHDLYIRFLVTRGVTDLHELNEQLESVELKPVTQNSLDEQWKLVEKSLPKRLVEGIENNKKPAGGEFLKWMGVLEVKEFWQREKQFLDRDVRKRTNLIFAVLDDPHLSLCLNALLIKNCPVKDIYEGLNAKFSCMLRHEHILLYRKFFFDPRRMTRTDWKRFLTRTESKERAVYFTALTEPLDIVKNELELPTRMSVSEPLQYLMVSCYKKAKQYLEVSTKESNAEARSWISQFSSLVDKHERYKTGDKADFSKQLQMEFDFIDTEFPVADADVLKQIQLELEEAKSDKDKDGGD